MIEPSSIQVLHVDDEPDFVEAAADMLEHEDSRFFVETATSASDGLDRLTADDFDCIVSDYQMPGQNGIEFLETVREEYPDLPFILYTGKGGEGVASDALSAGATDYLQKGSSTDQYELLANRITNAIEQHRASRRADKLDRVHTIRSEINQALIRSKSRSDAEARICEIISNSKPYLFAWIGDIDPETDHIEPRASAGVEEDYLKDITVTADSTATGHGPGGTAVRERRVAVSQNIHEDPDFEPWRQDALERGYQSVGAVPLEYGDTLYGVLGVYSERPYAFDEDEKELFVELGADIAHTFHSFEIQQNLQEERDSVHVNRLQNAMEASDIAWWEMDVSEGRTHFHDKKAELLGYNPENFDHYEDFTSLIHPNDYERTMAAMKSHLEGNAERYDVEYRIEANDGSYYWFHDIGSVTDWNDDGSPELVSGLAIDITARKRREQELKERKEQITEQNNALESFTKIVTDAERTVDQRITDLLNLGASHLDLGIGILSEIDDPEYTVRNVVAPGDTIEPGDTFDLTDTYCSLVYDSDGPVVFHSADAGSVKDHPAYQKRGMEAYVGVPIFVDDQRYGTLNFSDPESREAPITDVEQSFVRIMAEWIGTELTRQQRKQELERTSQFLQDSQEVANIGGWEVGLQSETLRWSEQVYRIHGLPLDTNPTPEDGIKFYHPEDRDTIREAFNRLTTEGEPYDLELRIIRADNDEVRWVRTRGEPRYEDDEIVAVHGTFQDITERKEREQELNRSQQIIENSTDIATIIDPEGTITYVSSAVKHVLGYDPEELIGANGYRYQPEETQRNVADAIEHVLDNPGETKTIQTRFRRADDSWCWIESTLRNRLDDGVIDGILVSSRDITERKRREQKLEQFREAVEQTAHVVYITDTDGTIEYVNPAFEEITGFSESEAVGQDPSILRSGKYGDEYYEELWETILSGEQWIEEIFKEGADGEEIVLNQTISPITDEDGQPQKFVAVGQDTTQQKEYEQKLEEQRDNLEVLNQVVRHDIRNDMQVVQARAELLENHIDEAGQENFESVLDATKSAIELTTTARNLAETMLSRQEDVEPVRLEDHLGEQIENARDQFQDVVISVEKIPDLRVHGNELLEAVFRNLIHNAVVHNDKQTPTVQVSMTVGTELIRVSVTDNGPGIPDNQKETIFGKGETGLESPGTGIGLYLVQTLVEQYGGEVWVEDNDPEGSVFIVELPVAE